MVVSRTRIASLGARLARAAEAFARPVPVETRAHLAELWAALPPALRAERQMIGRHAEGCGATIGAMPRCDFACRGCYLGAEANRTPALPVEAIEAQMRALRPRLGRWGNLQLTDGEVLLRPEHEVVRLLRTARSLELLPMLMTHGDAFRRQPGLLERLMIDGGLREVSLHVDTTQRGRPGFREARDERELDPLRAELAELVRRARRRTRRPLRVATTVTVTPENLAGVPAIVAAVLRDSDVYRIASFQPAAQVGRTATGLGGRVDVDALWARIAAGLAGPETSPEHLARGRLVFGHPDCTRVVCGVALAQPGAPTSWAPLVQEGDARTTRPVDRFLARWGGLTLRADPSLEALARVAGVVVRSPGLVASELPLFAWHGLRRLAPRRAARTRLAARLVLGRARLRGVAFVSHHFMDRAEVETPRGRERLDACVFRVPLDGALVPMCSVNATDARRRLYADLRRIDSDHS